MSETSLTGLLDALAKGGLHVYRVGSEWAWSGFGRVTGGYSSAEEAAAAGVRYGHEDLTSTTERLEASLEERDGLQQRVQALEAAHKPIKGTYACQRCGRQDGLDAVVSNTVWSELVDGTLHQSGEVTDGRWTILCLWCMDELAAEKGIMAEVRLHFVGRALHGSSGGTEAELQELRDLREIVSTETPIASLDLARSWQVLRAHMQEEIEDLRSALLQAYREANHTDLCGHSRCASCWSGIQKRDCMRYCTCWKVKAKAKAALEVRDADP